jgi:hypothetical protein
MIIPVLNTLYDVGFAALCLRITAVASRPGRRHHLRWIEPVTVSALLAVCNRALIDLGLLFPGPSPNGFLRPLLLYGADLTSLYGGVMLWRVLGEVGPRWIRPHRKKPARLPKPGRGHKARGGRRPRRRVQSN